MSKIVGLVIVLTSIFVVSPTHPGAAATFPLTVTVVPDATVVAQGGQEGYTITISNNSGATVPSVELSDHLPGDLTSTWTIVPTYSGPGSCSTTTLPSVQCAFGAIADGVSLSVHVQGTIQSDACRFANRVNLLAGNPQISFTTPTQGGRILCPSLLLSKVADSSTVSVGSTIGFTLTASNPMSPSGSTIAATSATLTDLLPGAGGLSWSIDQPYTGPGSCGISGPTGSQVLNCALGDFAVNATAVVHVSSGSSVSSCGSFSNSASLGATNLPTGPVSSQAAVSVRCSLVSVSSSSDSALVSEGSPMGISITVRDDFDDATFATLTSTLPAGPGVIWSIDPALTSPGCAITGIAGAQTLGCDFGTIVSSAAKSVHVTSPTVFATCGSYSTPATASASNGPSASSIASLTVICPDLSFAVLADAATVPGGSPIGFSYTASNSNGAYTIPATAVSLTAPLPALPPPTPGHPAMSWSVNPSFAGPGTCSIAGNPGSQTLSCSFGDLAPGSSAAVHVTANTSCATAGEYASSATLSATNTPSLSGRDNTSVSCADLSLELNVDPDHVGTAGMVVFSLEAKNHGPGGAEAVSVVDTLPDGAAFVSIGAVGWACLTPAVGASGVVQCTRSGLGNGISSTIMLTARMTAPGGTMLTDLASVASSSFDPKLANNNATTAVRLTGHA